MTPRRLTTILLAPVAGLVLAISVASPAAAVTLEQKVAVLNSWTQPNTTSYNGWNGARQNQPAWSAYTFDWSTDYCSTSPDQPLGFDFRIPCWRHDFGYRNYKVVNLFPANKAHVDDAFYFDLRAKCATYNVFVRPACYSLAWTYYQAVRNLGSLTVSNADLAKAEKLKDEGLRQQALANRPG
jgi:hypothetical protein